MPIPSEIHCMQCQMNWRKNNQWRIFLRQRVTGYWDITPHHARARGWHFADDATSRAGGWLAVNVLKAEEIHPSKTYGRSSSYSTGLLIFYPDRKAQKTFLYSNIDYIQKYSYLISIKNAYIHKKSLKNK